MAPVSSFQFKRASVSETGEFSGIASTFDGEPDRGGDVVERGAFSRTIKRLSESGAKLPLLWSHDASAPIGWIESMAEEQDGLRVDGRLLMGVEKATVAYEMMQAGAAYLSIGYVMIDGDRRSDGVRVLRDLDLAEVSVVTTPMNRDARVTDVKADLLADPVAFERAARERLGLSNREAKRLARGGWSALTRQDDDEEQELAEALARFTEALR